MNFKNMESVTILSKALLKEVNAGSDPPDCEDIPPELWKLVGCAKEITPPDC